MHRSFAKLLPWFYILGAQKNRLIEMALLSTHKIYIGTYVLVENIKSVYKLYSGTTRFLEFV